MTSEQLFEHITQCLETKTPQSILRAGDGEQMILNGAPGNANYVLDRQLGFVPTISKREAIRTRLVEAYKNCDIIGIPVKNQFLKDPDSAWSKVKPTLERFVTGKTYSDIDFHSYFLEKGYFNTLLNKVNKVYYISCRNIKSQLEKKYGLEVHAFHIAPEMKFDVGYKGKSHLDQILAVKQWITNQDINGDLCLFGAGVIGKIYGNWFRDAGGIAVDAGSCFDAWAGLRTRGKGRGAGVIDNTFKL